MAEILLPRNFRKQPQQIIGLAPHWRRGAFVVAPLSDPTWSNYADVSNPIQSIYATTPSVTIRGDGKVTTFSATNQLLGTTKNPNVTSPFTVFARVKPNSLTTGYSRILETDYATGLYLGSNTGSKYAFIVNNSTLEGCIGGQQVVGQIDFLVGVFEVISGVNTLKLYVNGVLTGQTTVGSGPSSSSTKLYIGRYPSAAGLNWLGDIDLVGYYNRAFTEQEIWSLYQNPWQLFQSFPKRSVFAVSSGNSYSITPSGGFVLSGTIIPAKGKVLQISGGVVFGGSSTITGIRSCTFNPSGGVVFTGSAPITYSNPNQYIITPTGGVAFGGTAPISSTNAKTYNISTSGGVVFTGGSILIKTHLIIPSGLVAFSGSAPLTSNTVIVNITTRLPLTGAGQ